MTDLSDCAVTVVGHHLYEHCDTAWRVALVGELLHVVGFTRASTASDRIIDRVALHVGTQSFVDGSSQPRIILYRSATSARCHHKFADQFGEQLAALGVLCRLAVFDVRPFTVARHLESIRPGTVSSSWPERQLPELLL